jgi:hypothetical protein
MAIKSYLAEAYMMAGIAIYLRDTLGLTTLPRPAERGGVAANINDNPPVRTAIKLPDNFRGATDPNDSNSKPSSNDWNKLFGSDDSQVQAEEQQLGQPARCRTETERTSNTAYVLSDGVTQSSIHGIALLLREVLCNDRCELPKAITDEHARVTPTDDGNGCEISVAIPNSVEIYLYRKMHAQDMAVQRCWDYTKVLFNTCLIRGANAGDGWVDGDQQNEFYQGGMRKINDPASFAVKAGNPLDTDKTLQFAPTSPGGQGK